MPDKVETKTPNTRRDNGFQQFLTSFDAIPKQIADAMLRQTTEEDHKSVITACGDAMREQVQGLTSQLREGWSRLSPQGQAEVNRVIAMSGSTAIFAGIDALAKNISTSTARIAISGFLMELKKLIILLFWLIFHTIPKWLIILLVLIDEIFDRKLSVGNPALASTLSRLHQDYMHEQILMARLNREYAAPDEPGNNEGNAETA
jgi:hypothetical protein